MADQGDSEVTRSADDAETEDEAGDDYQGPKAQPHRQQERSSRSRATSPSASAPSDSAAAAGDEGYARLTARQRARMEKEAGLAEDVAWHEMELLPNLTYTWKGKGIKESAQMTEEEWLKRQEALERRRMRSLRDKREAEEAVKAKIRRAVTARLRGKLGIGGDSGLDGQGGGDQEGGFVRPGYVKMRYTADGVTVAWHPAAHPLSLPVAVVAVPPLEPVDLPLQPAQPGEPWQVPPHSSNGSFKAGCVLTLQPASSAALAQQQSTAAEQPQQQQHQVVLNCIDSQGFIIGSLLQQEVLEALEFAGHWQPQQQAQAVDSGQQQQAPMLADASEAAMQQLDWQQWRAVVKSVKRASEQQLAAVVVRLVPQQQAS